MKSVFKSFWYFYNIGVRLKKNLKRMALNRHRGQYLTVGTFCNDWSHNFTESWSRPVHRPKNLTSRTRLRAASTRRTRPIMAPLVEKSIPPLTFSLYPCHDCSLHLLLHITTSTIS